MSIFPIGQHKIVSGNGQSEPSDVVTLHIDLAFDEDGRTILFEFTTEYSNSDDQQEFGGNPDVIIARDTMVRVKLNPYRWWTFADDVDSITLTGQSSTLYTDLRLVGDTSGVQARYNEAIFVAMLDVNGVPGSAQGFALNLDLWIDSATAQRLTLYPNDITNPKPPHLATTRSFMKWPADITNPKPPQSSKHFTE